ncbi:RNA polymerase II transcription factor-like protein [Dothidotthia symphoricarpi CBS 119687]|uniref:RNA polymerase II transcription factor-like protein n=1 Tax=Dothidotthia symphoricarpi CBS 119687 TaxID=1392245 RepID=A0A6A6AF30_9PLEO|nr:RNA polymerase II transcription factor-like protein [Dothidotthia symphoricarpi CBS 119687]KAF2130509.1 RNA polymerase II transcription factor-like protein [Dothidotthia symphoricarpi CBS 119687]
MSDHAAAQYKKQDGTISVSTDGKSVSWKAASGAAALSIATADIGNLQQTPATSAKASIKIVAVEPSPQAGNHTFTFTSAAARDDQQSITGLLRKWIEAAKSQHVLPAAPAGGGSGASAAMVVAQTTTADVRGKEDTYDDTKLLADLELQMSLLSTSPALRQRFDRALQEKPESVSIGQFSNQFWTTRVHMLRSHATERSQATGTYNVLSVVKTKLVNGSMTLNLTKEQIQLIFKQHTVVHKAYNENVPPMKEGEFWERFMNSKLMKKLKGERIADTHPNDPKLDLYLKYDENADESQQVLVSTIPNFINVEGNEQNHSQKQGNRPDITMRPANHEKAPILRVLNRMSEKMMKQVPLSDANRHAPAGLDEETYKELQLQDLQRAAEDNRVVLKVQDQSRFFSAGQSVQSSSSAATYTKRTPAQVLSTIQKDFGEISGTRNNAIGVNLQSTIGVNDDSSSDEENATLQNKRIGNKTSRIAATSQILSAIKKRHLHDDDYSLSKSVPISEQALKLGISESTLDNLTMTHNTTVEFLHYFWAVFYSGDPERANEAAKLIETLDRSLDRIKAVANAAESERAAEVERLKKENDVYTQHTGKKRRFDPNAIKGGANTVNQIVEPLFRAIDAARGQYQKALQEQLSQNGPSNGT